MSLPPNPVPSCLMRRNPPSLSKTYINYCASISVSTAAQIVRRWSSIMVKRAKGSGSESEKLLQPPKHRSLQEIMEETDNTQDFSFSEWSKVEGGGGGGGGGGGDDDEEARANEKLVRLFHTAMAASNVGVLKSLLAEDVEWWFHGAPRHQHMWRVLTGRRSFRSLTLAPTRITAFGDTVFVEGCGPDRQTIWAHIWTVKAGRLVELREYWNVGVLVHLQSCRQHAAAATAPPVWESKLWNADMSTPGLILTI